MINKLYKILMNTNNIIESEIAYSFNVDLGPDNFFLSLFLISNLIEVNQAPIENIYINSLFRLDAFTLEIYRTIGVNVLNTVIDDNIDNSEMPQSDSNKISGSYKNIHCKCEYQPTNLSLFIPDSKCTKPELIDYHGSFTIDGLLGSVGIPTIDKAIDIVNCSYEKLLLKLASQNPKLFGLFEKKRKRWLEWNSKISKQSLPLPNHIGFEKPLIAIETAGQCNYRCNYCPVSISPVRSGIMNEDIFKSLVEDLAPHDNQFQLRFHFYNEPLLDKRLPDLISYARGYLPNTYMRLVSNGELLDDNVASGMFSAGISQIAVSCHKEDIFKRLTVLKVNHPNWNLELRPSFKELKWSDRRGLVDLEAHGLERYTPVGVKPWGCDFLTLQIDYLGKVHLCCEDFNGDLVLGDVAIEGLLSILSRSQQTLKRAYCGFFDNTCAHCAGLEL